MSHESDTKTPREWRDGCCGGSCDSCLSLEGEGPWCARCGKEMPGSNHLYGWVDDLCRGCNEWMDEHFTSFDRIPYPDDEEVTEWRK